MPAPTRSAVPVIIALATLCATASPTLATAAPAMESGSPTYCLAPDGIISPPATFNADPTTNIPHWHVGLHSDPSIDVSDFLAYREGENFGIHPSGFGEMTETQSLTFDARGFTGTTTEDSNTGDIRFAGISFRNENNLYTQADAPAFYMYIGPSTTIIHDRCEGTFYDALGSEREAEEIYWTPGYQFNDPTTEIDWSRLPLSH
ncbi:hypothetical protein CFAEC_00950 [Corynebacterium faecale]|uniref:hypothetical protein n=1 Tax=Corynebacterium faecale TaxID=1758466 RepID=UPI0025B36326|nr:hypothetical protein [Corynebacterium faecale]WJY91053.1 hypothetical protein CFAEC_00950 [Corynebacterium faecale]